MSTRRLSAPPLAAWAALCLTVPALAVTPPPQALPSAVVRWTWPVEAREMVLDGGVVYVLAPRRLAALDAASGVPLWDQTYPMVGEDDQFYVTPVLLEDTLAVAAGKNVILFDRATGRVRRSIELGRNLTAMGGPPLVVAVRIDREHTELVALDAATGDVRARRDAGRSHWFFALLAGTVVTQVERTNADGRTVNTLIGLRASDLSEVWRLPPAVFRRFERIDGRLYGHYNGSDDFAPVDVATGWTGARLPPRAPSRDRIPQRWDLRLIDLDPKTGAVRVRRDDLASGRPLWSTELPCSHHYALAGNRMSMLCASGAGSLGYLMVVDWASGVVEHMAAAPAFVGQTAAFDDVLITRAPDGVVAYSTREVGPPEASVPLRERVHRLLARKKLPEATWAADLQDLGPDALPLIADAVPTMEVGPLRAAARVLGEARYTPAGPALARRLADVARGPHGNYADPLEPLLAALGRTAGSAEVPLIAAVLGDATRRFETREAAFTALAEIGTPDAIRALDWMLDAAAPARLVWSPPSPPATVDPKYGARLGRPDGSVVVLFRDGLLGGVFDLWAADLDAGGRARGASVFLGALGSASDCYLPSPCRMKTGNAPLRARLEGRVVEIQPADPEEPRLRFDLEEAARDSDGDGLTDLVERRMGTSPTRRDTDGDGIPDAEDPAPDSGRAPAGEQEEIASAIFRQFLALQPSSGLLAVRSDFALHWVGRLGPTVTLTDKDDPRGGEFFGTVSIQPAGEDEQPRPGLAPIGPDERLYIVARGGAAYHVVVRRLGTRWYVRGVRLAMIV